MTTSSLLEDRNKVLGWLSYGRELALNLKGDRARHTDVIWCLLCDAVANIDKTPDQERRWLTSGQRSGGWNLVGMSKSERHEIECVRILSAMKPFDGDTKCLPQKDDIDRALGVLEWMRWCNSARLPDRLIKASIALARGGDTELVHRLYCPTRKPHRQNVLEIRVRTTGYIMAGLRADLNIIPASGISFQEALNAA